MLERAEQRSKTLGITSTSKFPLTEYNQDNSKLSGTGTSHRQQSSPRKSSTPTKRASATQNTLTHRSDTTTTTPKKGQQLHRVSAETKENVDLALEINITTGPNVQVSHLFYFVVVLSVS